MGNSISRFIHDQWQLGQVGTIAGISTVNRAETRDYLIAECQRLQDQGFGAAIAPMERNTWYPYRCVVESKGRPWFWGEPDLPSYWREALIAEGFEAIAHYRSAECTDLTRTDPRLGELNQHFSAMGVTLHPANLQNPQPDLARIYQVAIAAFQHNYLYEPMGWAEFRTLYEPLLPHLNPAMVSLAEQAGSIIGFILGIPDWRSPHTTTIILKTVAIKPERQYAGLGRWLVGQFHAIAVQQEYDCIIHALMHEANPSLNISRRYAQPFRRYALWTKLLNA